MALPRFANCVLPMKSGHTGFDLDSIRFYLRKSAFDEERVWVDELAQRFGGQISINTRPGFHDEQFAIAVG